MGFPYEEDNIKTIVQIKNINNVKYNYYKKYNTVNDAYSSDEIYKDNIIFGSDILKGLNTIEEFAGPPNRILAYLKTLDEYCEYIKIHGKIHNEINIIQAFGCICSGETKKDMKDKRAIKERTFHTGNNEEKLFTLHLKPTTIPPYKDIGEKKETVRIYFDWDDVGKKIIVGWIGKHPYLPPKNP